MILNSTKKKFVRITLKAFLKEDEFHCQATLAKAYLIADWFVNMSVLTNQFYRAEV